MNTHRTSKVPAQSVQTAKFIAGTTIEDVSTGRISTPLEKAMLKAEEKKAAPSVPTRYKREVDEDDDDAVLTPFDKIYIIPGRDIVQYGLAAVLLGAGSILFFQWMFGSGAGGVSTFKLPEGLTAEALEALNGGL